MKKFVVTFNGQRVSGQVHEGQEADARARAEAERNSFIQTLTESADSARVEVKELLMG